MKSLRHRLSGLAVASALASSMVMGLTGAASAASITLYDDTAGNTPGAQPWLFAADDSLLSGGSATETANANGVALSTDNPVSAGYSNYVPVFNTLKNVGFPALDRGPGLSLSFELQIASEGHGNNDRAGFSVILLADDLQGIELGFWADEVWAQSDSPLFTHAEGAVFDTTAAEVLYDLAILGSNYSLTANGNPLLQGALRNYSGFGNPYDLPNFVFLGDDTSSAQAVIGLGEVILNTTEPASVPAPSVALLLLLALLLLRRSASQA